MVKRPWLSLVVRETSFIPPSSESNTTSMLAPGLLVVPLLTAPPICAANILAERIQQNAMMAIRFMSDKGLSSIRWLLRTQARLMLRFSQQLYLGAKSISSWFHLHFADRRLETLLVVATAEFS